MYFLPPRKFSSYPGGTAHLEFLDESGLIRAQTFHFLCADSTPLPCRTNDALILVPHGHDDESLRLQSGDDVANLPVTQVEEISEVTVRSKTAPLVVEA